MRLLDLPLPLLLGAALLSACVSVPVGDGQTIEGSGTLAEETRTLSAFHPVELSMQGKRHIESGASVSVRIAAEDNLLPHIETHTSGGELEIRTTPGLELRPHQPINYCLTVPSLDGIQVSSSGSIGASDLVTPRFRATISSSGSITLQSLQADTLDFEITSSGNLSVLGGDVARQTIGMSSSGE